MSVLVLMPAFGHLPLDQIRRSAVKHWAIGLRARYSLATVRGIVTLMSLMLTAAVEERMIANPIQGLRMAEPRSGHAPRSAIREVRKRPVPNGDQVLAIADRVKILGEGAAQVMVITAAFTGMRWGEITGLSKRNCHLDQLYLQVDPETGALHEVRGAMWLGPRPRPQRAASICRPSWPRSCRR
ncbi:hypothetical protein [Actinomadura sp. 6N118]|uniref:hypothetical protein n=1 Tax=Actinomadura sp. 6N118 TaxID=3375151 RepID=UPI0037A09C0D